MRFIGCSQSVPAQVLENIASLPGFLARFLPIGTDTRDKDPRIDGRVYFGGALATSAYTLLHPAAPLAFLGSRQQPSPRCAVSGFAIENDPSSRQGGGASRPTSSHDLPKCSGRQEKGSAAR